MDSDMLFYAFRYCLGRMTYSVSTTVDEILRVWDDIPAGDRQRMRNEAKRALDAGQGGMQMDRDQWQRIIDRYDGQKAAK